MASNLRVDNILPSNGTNIGIGTAGGTITFLGNSNLTTSGDVTIGGNLGVAGTITYEDVARVDATGISTFREGFGVGPLAGIALTAYKDGSIRTTGIITATSFSGGLPITNGANNRVITATSGSALLGEANLTFDNSTLKVGGDSGNSIFNLHRTNAAGSNGNTFGNILWSDNNANTVAQFRAVRESAVDDAALVASTRPTTGSITERLRITSGGQLNLGGSSTQTTHLLHLQSTGDAGIHIRADSDNSGENDNPYISMGQDGSTAQQFKLGMVGQAAQEFAQSVGNASFLHANNANAQPLQLAHMDNLAVTISNTEQTHFHSYSGNAVGGMKIANRGNDTAAALLLQGHNNSGGTPGQATNTQLTHKGANATFNFKHLGTDRLVIGSNGVVSGDLQDTSDIALKKDIESISTSCIDNIKQLNPVTFKWKDNSRKDIGFIAQEVEVILPDLVNGEDGVKSINTIGLVSQLTKALQEAITEIETLKTKVAALEGS